MTIESTRTSIMRDNERVTFDIECTVEWTKGYPPAWSEWTGGDPGCPDEIIVSETAKVISADGLDGPMPATIQLTEQDQERIAEAWAEYAADRDAQPQFDTREEAEL
jgi:hypothetical protein